MLVIYDCAMRLRIRQLASLLLTLSLVGVFVELSSDKALASGCVGTNAATFSNIQSIFTSGGTACLTANLVQADLVNAPLYNLSVAPGVSATLDLNGHSITYFASAVYAGIRVPDTSTLTITDSVGTGLLDVTGGQWANDSGTGAGIGGDGGTSTFSPVAGGNAGTINILGGRVIARGGASTGNLLPGAGIGGGGGGLPDPSSGGNGGTVTISGGFVTALGGFGGLDSTAAGIGGGAAPGGVAASSGGSLTINGAGSPTTAGAGYSPGFAQGGPAATVSVGSQPTGVSFLQVGTNATSPESGGNTEVRFKNAVTFDSMGGSTASSQTVNYAEQASEPTDPTKSGYAFSGWRTGSATGPAYSFTSTVTAPVVLYAAWDDNPNSTLAKTGVTSFAELAFAGALLFTGLGSIYLSRRRKV
jgi:uncharacterized repeat protein (TIGR02543 family)/LPXTG-motif cell wall-anchored protein